MITGRQIRAARGLLGWKAEDLATRADVARETISKIEADAVQPHEKTMASIARVFDENGVEFIGDRGVGLKNDEVVTLKGDNIFFRILDDVVTTVRSTKMSEVLFACVSDQLSPPAVIENYRRLRKAGINMRSLIKEGDAYLMGRLEEYRYLPAKFFINTPQIIYGNKVATMLYTDGKDKEIAKSALIVRNAYAAEAQRNLFNFIWSVTNRPEKTEAKIHYE